MILPFSTKLNGKPTYFVEKIQASLLEVGRLKNNILFQHHVADFVYDYLQTFNKEMDEYENAKRYASFNPKLHTLRDDKKNRWKKGTKIDYFINCRQKNMFRFAPKIPVISTQKCCMSYLHSKIIFITIDGRELLPTEREEFAINDGFNNWDDFFDYFMPSIQATEDNFLVRKLIHWTDKKY